MRSPATHEPVPLQVDAVVRKPASQLCAAQIVVGPYLRQPPLPLQVPSLPQLVGPSSLHVFFGSWPPAWTAVQAPSVPGRLHEKQLPPHAPLQHTPSAQKLLAHSAL